MPRVYPSLLGTLAAVGVPALVLAAVFLQRESEPTRDRRPSEVVPIRRPVRALPSGAGPSTAGAYTILDLGTLGGQSSRAYGISDRGHVVGQSGTSQAS